MDETVFSVVIPAHNEEHYIGNCLQSVVRAAELVKPDAVEIIVVANRCTDRTAEIAGEFGARVLTNDEKCISAIRNTGIRAANGGIIVTLDADSVMSEQSLREIRRMLESGAYIGGGTRDEIRHAEAFAHRDVEPQVRPVRRLVSHPEP